MPLVEQGLPTLPDHLSSPPVFIGVRVTRSLVESVCFVDLCLSFWLLFFGHFVCPSINEFWLPLWYLQTLLRAASIDNLAGKVCRTLYRFRHGIGRNLFSWSPQQNPPISWNLADVLQSNLKKSVFAIYFYLFSRSDGQIMSPCIGVMSEFTHISSTTSRQMKSYLTWKDTGCCEMDWLIAWLKNKHIPQTVTKF